jgi:hypothetical protein
VRDETSPNERIHGRKNGNNKSKISPIPSVLGLSFLEMKFRVKFEKINWVMPVFAAFYIAFELHDSHDSAAFKTFIVLSWSLWILLNASDWLFSRLELDASHLRQRGLFRTKVVSLAEITRVRKYGITTGQLIIEFTRPKALSESIVVNPKDRIGFISAMRQFAPQASFE